MDKYVKILLIHIVLIYLIPSTVIISLTKLNIIHDYDYNLPTLHIVLNVISTCIVYIVLIKLFKPDKILSVELLMKRLKYFIPVSQKLCYIFIILSISFFIRNANNFRYQSDEYTYSSLIILLTISIRALIEFLILFDVINIINNGKYLIFGNKKHIKYILIISLYFTSSGLMPLLTSFLIHIFYFYGLQIKLALSKFNIRTIYKTFYITIIFVIGIPIVYFTGWMIKTNSLETSKEQFRKLLDVEQTLVYFARRFSVYYISANNASDEAFSEKGVRDMLIKNMINNAQYRIYRLLNIKSKIERPYITNTSRYNFEKILYYDKNINKASVGASAGIIGSFSYISPYPLCSIFAGIYMYIIFSSLGFVKNNLPLLFLVFIWFNFRGFRANPGDFLNIFDPNSALFIIYCLLLITCIKIRT